MKSNHLRFQSANVPAFPLKTKDVGVLSEIILDALDGTISSRYVAEDQ